MPDYHSQDTVVHGSLTVDTEINVGSPVDGLYPLSTYATGRILETTMICLKPSTVEDKETQTRVRMAPFCCGAEFYKAENYSVSGAAMFESGFVTDTANSTYTYHQPDDNLGVFGSYAYSGGTVPDHTTKFVGGIVLQASEEHSSTRAGTRLLLGYMPNGDNKEAEVGAIIDGDGTFAVAKTFRHVGIENGTVGFFGVTPKSQQEVRFNGTTDEKVADLVTALFNLGLIKPTS